MVAQIAAELNALAEAVTIAHEPAIQGWAIDLVVVDGACLDAIGNAYRALLAPKLPLVIASGLEAAAIEMLGQDGIPVERIFSAGKADDKITRADMIELLAAAIIVAADGVPVRNLHLPNVPKGSRMQSAPGIDVMAVLIDESHVGEEMGPGERLILCSVKHTVADVGDLRRKLTESINSESLSPPYLLDQVRVLYGRLLDRGIDAVRFFLAIDGFPDANRISLVAAGAADVSSMTEFARQLNNLPDCDDGCHCFRRILIPGISDLHAIASP